MATTTSPPPLPRCRKTPNCVSTQASDPEKKMDPIPYAGDPKQARERLLAVLRAWPRARITREEPGAITVECRSRIFRFVDDVDFRFDDEARQIHFRSASRLGRRDFGVNRQRMEEMRQRYNGS
ncbi:MAG TPA: DUF1499 domain-containing protein [Thermoanaerobaculia bacterium]|nr:DUF1499 domain-containing protein [Thermoanaerobaculia bacterium]